MVRPSRLITGSRPGSCRSEAIWVTVAAPIGRAQGLFGVPGVFDLAVGVAGIEQAPQGEQ